MILMPVSQFPQSAPSLWASTPLSLVQSRSFLVLPLQPPLLLFRAAGRSHSASLKGVPLGTRLAILSARALTRVLCEFHARFTPVSSFFHPPTIWASE